MAEIRPFRAYRYDTNRVALKDVLTQPYDKITPDMQERYYAASPYNLIAIEKGKPAPGDTPETMSIRGRRRSLRNGLPRKFWRRMGRLRFTSTRRIIWCRGHRRGGRASGSLRWDAWKITARAGVPARADAFGAES